MGHRAVSHLHFVRGATELASGEIEHAGFDLCRGEAHGVARKVSDSARGWGLAMGGGRGGVRGALRMLPIPRLLQPIPMPRLRLGGASFSSGRIDSTEALARVSISFTGML